MSASKVYLAIVFLALVGAPPCFADYPMMFNSANSKMTNDGKLKVYWVYNQSTDSVCFKVVANVTGYVGVGVSASGARGMSKYDMAVGGVQSDGTAYLWDYLTQSYSKPPRDATANLDLKNATEENNVTTLMYCRKRDTGDAVGDLVILPVMDMKYAYKYTVDDPQGAGGIMKHDMEGTWAGVKLVPEVVPTTDAGPTVTFSDKQMRSLDGGNFKYYWDVNDGMICFKVMAKANGWVALGVTKEKSSAMVGFDVGVGGVAADGSSYLVDYYTSGKKQPSADASQDLKVKMAEQKNGYTTLKFCRKLKTGDANNDVEIKPGLMYVVWAYHSTMDVVNNTFSKHSMRGYDQVALVAESSAFLAAPSVLLVLCAAIMQFMS